MTVLTNIQDLLIDEQRKPLFQGVKRRLDYRLIAGKAFVCIGVRRCGKSVLLNQIMGGLLEAGEKREDLIYVNLFDDRLESVRQGSLDLLLEAYYGLYPEKKEGGKKLHFFLDEAQMAVGWEMFTERLLRIERMEVYLSGSSARLLSKEIGTAMRGRALTWELFPFSFEEFLDARGVGVDLRGQQARLRVRKAFQDYWICGGFPEVMDEDERIRVMIHQEYFKTMIFRDVVDRNDALHPRAVRDLSYRLLNSSASMYTINALTHYLKSIGHKASKSFVGDVLEWLEDAFALFTVKLFDASLNRQNVNPKKIYGIDHAMIRSCSTGILVNSGHLLENMVFVDARRRGYAVHYYKTHHGREVDFCWMDGRQMHFVQVAERIPEGSETRARELTALRDALQEHPRALAVLVTLDEDEIIHAKEGDIRIVPIWKYLIERP